MSRVVSVCWRFLLVLLLLSPAVHAGERSNRVEAELISEYRQVAQGGSFWAALRLRPESGWHIYWRNPGDAGLAPVLTPTGQFSGFEPRFIWPLPQKISIGSLTDYGYTGEVILPFRLTSPGGGEGLSFQARADWLVCKDVCIPEQAELTLDLPTGVPQSSEQADSIAKTLQASPQPFTGEAQTTLVPGGYFLNLYGEQGWYEGAEKIHFFPYDDAIEHGARQKIAFGENALRLELVSETPEAGRSLAGVLVFEDARGRRRGWEISAEAGVAPKVEWVEEFSADAPVGLIFLIVLAFAGGLLMNFMPCVLPVLAMKVNHIIAVGKEGGRSPALAYAAGVMTCFCVMALLLLVLRSAGEAVGLGFHLQYPAVTAGLALLMSAIGYNLLGLFSVPGFSGGEQLSQQAGNAGHFWTGALAALLGAPCITPFMAAPLAAVLTQPAFAVLAVFVVMAAGFALPLVLIGCVPALASFLPAPGAWMVALRQALSVPVFLTSLWLAWVFSGQAGNSAGFVLLACCILLGFGLWLLNSGVRSARTSGGLTLLLAISISLFVLPSPPPDSSLQRGSWSQARLSQALERGQPVFADFTARWCLTCQLNKRIVLDSLEIRQLMIEKNVLFLTADWTARDAQIARELERYGRAGVPLYLYFSPQRQSPYILPTLLTASIVRQTLEQQNATDSQ